MTDTTNSDGEFKGGIYQTVNTTQKNTTTYNSCESHSNLQIVDTDNDQELIRIDKTIANTLEDADGSHSSYMGSSDKRRRETKVQGRIKILKKKKHNIQVKKKVEKQMLAMLPPKTEKVMNFSFTPEKIMALMSSARLKNLGEKWTEEGLNLTEFVQMMINHISTKSDDERYELIHGCYKLFTQVDINGDGMMEWGEFMQYIIDAVQGNSISGEDENETVQEQIARIKAKKYHRFQFALKPIDKTNHSNAIAKAIHLGNSLLCFERFQPSIKIYDFEMNLLKQTKMDIQQQGAFVTSITYCEDQKIYGVACSDSYLHFWVQGKLKVEPHRMIKAPCIQTKIWYMPNQKVWLTAGRDFKLRHWTLSKNSLDPLLQTLSVHTDEITDCVEIYSPQCIATCSLDRTICMVSLENPMQKRVIQENHDTGIRHLRYQVANGAQMVSIGNEIYANVWAPESLVSDIHIGKLRGHKKGIVDGSFLNKAPYFVTIDEENVIFFWDMITLINVQTIITPQKFACEGMIALSNDIFWAYGRRFFQYDALQFEDDEAGSGVKNEEDYPLFAQFNYYMLSIFVVKKSEVRIYNVDKGQLFSLHSNIFKEEIAKAEISKFKIDKRHRKAYVSNNKGEIFVINCQNGIVCKNVTQYLEDRRNLKNSKLIQSHESIESLGSSNYGSDSQDDRNMLMGDDPSPKKKKGKNKKVVDSSDDEEENAQKNLSSPEIVDMHLVWEDDLIMMLCCNAKEYIVYDESDTDKSQILRRVQGAHKEEITIMAYDYHLSLVATGCINGEIAIYDFEMSKVEGLLLGHSGDITALEFFSPYPLLISASMDCHVCIWGVRPIAEKYLNVCIKRYMNLSWNKQTQKEVPCIVSRLMLWENENSVGIKRYRKLKGQTLPAINFRKFEHNFAFSFKEDFDAFYDDLFPQKIHAYINYPQEYKVDKLIATEEYKELLRDEKSAFFVTQAQSVGTDYNDRVNERTYRAYLYVSDEYGFMKIWELASFIKNYDIPRIPSRVQEKGQAYNPRRQEIINCSAFTNQNRKFYKLKPQKLPQAVDPSMTGVLIREILGHQAVVTSLSVIELNDAKMLLTSSKDCKVRVWSMDLDMYGNINGKTEKDDPKWKFPSSQKVINQMKEIEQVEEVMDNLDLGLNEPRLPLIVDEARREKKKVERPAERANWLLMQEEKMKKEQELDKKTRDMIKQNQRRIERENMIMNNMDRFAQQQDIQLSMLALTKNNYQGPNKKLYKELEKKHKEIEERDKLNRDKDNLSDTKNSKSPHKKTIGRNGFSSRNVFEQTAAKNMNQSGFKNVQMAQEKTKETKNNDNKEPLDQTKRSNQSQENRSPQLTQRGSSFQVPVPKTTRSKKNIESKFDISNHDKSLIQDYSKVPKLRYALDSLKKKDRFQTVDKEEGLEHYLQSKKFQLKSSIVRGIRNKRTSGRPMSIADSEIQQFSEMGGQDFITLSRDLSKESIEQSHINIKRRHNQSMVVQPILHIVDNSAERGKESQKKVTREDYKPISILQKGKHIGSALDQEISRNEATRDINQIPTISLKDLKITLPEGTQPGTSPQRTLKRHPLALKFQSINRPDDPYATSTRDETSLISTRVQMHKLISPKFDPSQIIELPPIKTNQQSTMTIQENVSRMQPGYLNSNRNIHRQNLNQSKTLQSSMLKLQSQRSLQQSVISQKDIAKNEQFASLMEKYCGEKPLLAELNRQQREKLEQQREGAKKIHKNQKMGDKTKKPDNMDLCNELKMNSEMLEKHATKLELKEKANRKKISEALDTGLPKKAKQVAQTIIKHRREAAVTRDFCQLLQKLSSKIEEGATTQIQIVSQRVNSQIPQVKKAMKSMELKKAMNHIEKDGIGQNIDEFAEVFEKLQINTDNLKQSRERTKIKKEEVISLVQEVQNETQIGGGM